MAKNPFRFFKASLEIIQVGVPRYAAFPLSRLNVDDLLQRARERKFAAMNCLMLVMQSNDRTEVTLPDAQIAHRS